MVLHHVAHRPGVVVVAAAVLHAKGLVDADLHMVDVRRAPDRLEQRIGEAQGHQVLHGFLAQVVVDAEHPRLVEHPADGLVDRPRRVQRMAQRFSSTMRACGRRGRRWRGSARSARTGSARSPGSAPAPGPRCSSGAARDGRSRRSARRPWPGSRGARRSLSIVRRRTRCAPPPRGRCARRGRGRRRCPARCGRGRRSAYRPAGGPPGAGDRAPAAACAGPGRRYRRRPGCRRTLEWLVYSRQAPDGVGWAWLTVCSITTRLLQRIEPSL